MATRLHGVRVIRRSDLPRPATLAASGTRWLIILDSSLGDREALYFKLRELKHLLDSTEPHVSGSEWHRHQFAVSVLMPRAWVARDYLRGLRDPELLARRYRVPPDAMRDRLRDLALWDGQPETEDRS